MNEPHFTAHNQLARATDPETSHEAAARSDRFRARHIALIWDALRTRGPMTAKEIAIATRLDSVQVSRRGKEMVEALLIAVLSDRRDGCRIWKAIPPRDAD